MHRLYLDTCILNDALVLIQQETNEPLRQRDLKSPLQSWIREYMALRYILDLDREWELQFGTSDATLAEIARFRATDVLANSKKTFLMDLAEELHTVFASQQTIDTSTPEKQILCRVEALFGRGYDSLHLARAICGGWDYFISTDFRSVLDNQNAVFALERLLVARHGHQKLLWPQGAAEAVERTWGIRACSPLQFLDRIGELPLASLVRHLHGSWTDADTLCRESAQLMSALVVRT